MARLFVRRGQLEGLYEDRLQPLLEQLSPRQLSVQRVSRVEAEVDEQGRVVWRVDLSLSGLAAPDRTFATRAEAIRYEQALWHDHMRCRLKGRFCESAEVMLS